jgi:hypothetical protein
MTTLMAITIVWLRIHTTLPIPVKGGKDDFPPPRA